MRLTRSSLNNLLRFVNRNLNRPDTAWKKDSQGHVQAQVGYIGLSTWSPGDGWTRYQVYELMDKGGESTISPVMTCAECFYYLRGLLDAQQDNRLRPYPETSQTARPIFDEQGHEEKWRNTLASELNTLLARAQYVEETMPHGKSYEDARRIDREFVSAVLSVVERVAGFEEIEKAKAVQS